MITRFFKKQSIPEVDAIRRSLNQLKKRIMAESYDEPDMEYGQCERCFEDIKQKSLMHDDEVFANATYIANCYFKVFVNLSSYFGMLSAQRFEESWDKLQDCLYAIKHISEFVDQANGFELPDLYQLLLGYESLYPYEYFLSPEYIIRQSHCSICGKSMRNPACPHLKGHLYNGEYAYEVVDNAEMKAIAVVREPADRRRVLRVFDNAEQNIACSMIFQRFLSLSLPKLQRFSVHKEALCETCVPRTDEAGGHMPCPCGSGSHIGRCCDENPSNARSSWFVIPGEIVELILFGSD